jgi:acetyltransferase-like isoleucine patch superfamily enzyme
MNWSAPIPVNLPADTAPWNRILTFLGHYDTRFYCTAGAYVDVGAGSLPCVNNLMLIPFGEVGKVGEIGRFCEMHPSARVQVRGDHANDQPVNISFTGIPLMDGAFDRFGMQELRPFTVGSGVVVSANAQVLSGLRVGDGVVLGASSLLTKDAEPLGIYAGVPARKLRAREAFAPWWDFDIAYLMANRDQLQRLAADRAAPHVYRTPRPRFVLRKEASSLSVLGFLEGDQIRSLDQAPVAVRDYVVQAFSAATNYWLADCWAA